MKTKIGIIGLGYVGGAVQKWFESQNEKYDLFLYDKYKKIGSIDEINKADIIFVAVPTPFHEDGTGYDDSEVRDALSNIEDGKVVVLKSTILPGSTDILQKEYPHKILMFNPEFLRAKSAIDNFIKPDRQLVGYTTKESKKVALQILDMLPSAPFTKIIKAKEAEMVKFFSNTFLATRVIFANQMYDLCKKLGIDYDVVKQCAGYDPRIGHSHFDIFLDVFHEDCRGYGGPCLPKDTKALLQLAKETGVSMELFKTMEKINNKLREKKEE